MRDLKDVRYFFRKIHTAIRPVKTLNFQPNQIHCVVHHPQLFVHICATQWAPNL